jgi:hypothetical protein
MKGFYLAIVAILGAMLVIAGIDFYALTQDSESLFHR